MADRHISSVYWILLTREKDTLAILRRNAGHSWQIVEGEIEQEQADAIGAAIDKHYV